MEKELRNFDMKISIEINVDFRDETANGNQAQDAVAEIVVAALEAAGIRHTGVSIDSVLEYPVKRSLGLSPEQAAYEEGAL